MEYVSGNIFIREMNFSLAGESVNGHAHAFDHTTYIACGGLRIEKLDKSGAVVKSIEKWATAPHNWVLVKAGVCHRITALADNSRGHCIYSHRTPQGDVVEQYDAWGDAYV